jgi:oligopeptide/dipeptide ABC transporter ATP-binding protein
VSQITSEASIEPAVRSALSIRDVHHSYIRGSALSLSKSKQTEVLKGISLDVPEGRTLGLVGESGCGKTTLVKAILRLIEPSSGQVLLKTDEGEPRDLLALSRSELKRVRQKLQVVFQDPYGSLNPRMSVFRTVSEPLTTHLGMSRSQAVTRVAELMELVGLDPKVADRYPHEFSGGQRQRIGIARALAFEPRVLILDEPVSALDVSVQAQILNLIIGLQKQLNLTYLFVSHDLAVVEHVADEVAVMYLGRIVEHGATDSIFRDPAHPYTQALLSASPIPDVELERQRTRIVLKGDITSATATTSGCQFAPRCPVGSDDGTCASDLPALAEIGPGHRAACHYPRGWQS